MQILESREFQDWLSALRDGIAVRAVLQRIDRLRVGNAGQTRSVGGGVSELKIDHGPGYRVYYGRQGDQLVLLLCGGDKGTQTRDIDRARKLWELFKEEA